jgi:peptide-methionine (S)-S-oxide reductase
MTERDSEIATFGGGCFWCTEAVFEQIEGVLSVVPGYCGGSLGNPSYREVCRGDTGHAEVVRIMFDPQRVDFTTLLEVFFATHDPTTPNRQGHDVGSQYRSVIFYHSVEQKAAAEKAIAAFNAENPQGASAVTEVLPEQPFYPAEDYHHRYFRQNPEQAYCQAVISPKLSKLRKHFRRLIRTSEDSR